MYRILYFFSLQYTVDLSVYVNLIFFSDYIILFYFTSSLLVDS